MDVEGLSPEQVRLLETMIQDHIRNLDEQLLRVRAHLTPFLSMVVPGPVEIIESADGEKPSLPDTVLLMFERTRLLNENVLALFAGEGLPLDLAQHRAPDAPVRVRSAAEVARELQVTLTILPSQVVELGIRLAESPSRLSATRLQKN